MRYFEVIMKNGEKNYLSYDAVEIQREEISEIIQEIDRNDFLREKEGICEELLIFHLFEFLLHHMKDDSFLRFSLLLQNISFLHFPFQLYFIA